MNWVLKDDPGQVSRKVGFPRGLFGADADNCLSECWQKYKWWVLAANKRTGAVRASTCFVNVFRY